jgi:hypothetical protein
LTGITILCQYVVNDLFVSSSTREEFVYISFIPKAANVVMFDIREHDQCTPQAIISIRHFARRGSQRSGRLGGGYQRFVKKRPIAVQDARQRKSEFIVQSSDLICRPLSRNVPTNMIQIIVPSWSIKIYVLLR